MSEKAKIGLVLEGGAMRGMYTAGVLDAFMREDIRVDGIVGVSAGALFGANYASGQIGRTIRYNKRFNSDNKYIGILPLLMEGNIVNTKYAYYNVPRKLDPFDDEAFKASGIPFYAVITELESGEAEYIRIESVMKQMDTLRASASMPYVSKPVEINGKYYLDGAVADSIPFEWMAEQGYDKLIVVLTRDWNYKKKSLQLVRSSLWYHKYPKFRKKFLGRDAAYNASTKKLAEWEAEGKAFVIRPSRPIKIARIEGDPEKLQEVYDLGESDTMARLESLRKYIG